MHILPTDLVDIRIYFFTGNRVSVNIKCDLIEIGINSHRNRLLRSFGQSPTENVQHRLVGPVCLVKIECIFLDFTIMSDQALVVDVRPVATVGNSPTEIEHIPDELAPDILAVFDPFPDLFMIKPLVLFREKLAISGIRPFGRLLLLAGGTAGTVFTEAAFDLRMLFMQAV